MMLGIFYMRYLVIVILDWVRAITYNYNLKELIPKQTRARKIFPNGHLDSDECGYVFYTGMTENEEGYMIASATLKGKSRIWLI